MFFFICTERQNVNLWDSVPLEKLIVAGQEIIRRLYPQAKYSAVNTMIQMCRTMGPGNRNSYKLVIKRYTGVLKI
jgi:hypothetical protein